MPSLAYALLFAAGHNSDNWTLRYTLECCKKKLLNELIINRTFCDPHFMLFFKSSL